jgi:hypothetical protein
MMDNSDLVNIIGKTSEVLKTSEVFDSNTQDKEMGFLFAQE